MQLLKQSTVATVVVGPVLDADGAAVSTAVLADFSISKNGSVAVLTGATVTHATNGFYTIAFTTGNTDSLGRLDLIVNNAAMSMSNHRYDVIASQVYDSVVSGSDLLHVDIRELGGSTQNADRILIGANSNRTVQVTGSSHVAADVHEFQTDVIDSDAIAASAVTEIQAGLATSSGVTSAFTEIKGAGWSSASDTLEKIADVAGASVTVAPLSATSPDRITKSTVQTLINDTSAVGPIAIKDSSGNAVSLSGLTLKVCIEKIDGTVLANLTPTISGASNNQITFTPNADSVSKTGTFRWALRQVSDGKVYGLGEFVVDPAAKISP